MTGMDPDGRVALAEIKGDVKLILAGQERTHTDVQEIRKTLASHNQRIGFLETDKTLRDGERKGVITSSKIVGWGISLLLGTGLGATLLELLK